MCVSVDAAFVKVREESAESRWRRLTAVVSQPCTFDVLLLLWTVLLFGLAPDDTWQVLGYTLLAFNLLSLYTIFLLFLDYTMAHTPCSKQTGEAPVHNGSLLEGAGQQRYTVKMEWFGLPAAPRGCGAGPIGAGATTGVP